MFGRWRRGAICRGLEGWIGVLCFWLRFEGVPLSVACVGARRRGVEKGKWRVGYYMQKCETRPTRGARHDIPLSVSFTVIQRHLYDATRRSCMNQRLKRSDDLMFRGNIRCGTLQRLCGVPVTVVLSFHQYVLRTNVLR